MVARRGEAPAARAPATMDAASTATLLAAFTTALVALMGYWINQHAKRREQKSRMYAEALQVIHSYEDLPYLIRCRPASDPETRAALAQQISDVFTKINLHQNLLFMDSYVVGEAYADLFQQTRRHAGPHRLEAWNTPPVATDQEMSGRAYFPYDNQPEQEICLLAMRRELTAWGWLFRPHTHRQIRHLRHRRTPWSEPDFMRETRARLLSPRGGGAND
ncbi:hypothetical protein [Streptomyces flaveolus]|uniref:hypothetical protein n=1 Tax=Streptomyces flaveolus TaxID=67297 RepID=UPI0033F2C738